MLYSWLDTDDHIIHDFKDLSRGLYIPILCQNIANLWPFWPLAFVVGEGSVYSSYRFMLNHHEWTRSQMEWHRPAETPEGRYADAVNDLARRFIYDEGNLDEAAIEKAIEKARRTEEFASIEEKEGRLESLAHLLKGIRAHEQANKIHGGAWQAELMRQKGLPSPTPKPPETLTREEVASMFELFKFKDGLVAAESEALKQYDDLLMHPGEIAFDVFDGRIIIKRTDIDVLANDIRIRQAERNPDEKKRKEELRALDDELVAIIASVPDDDWGKRFELEEIFLLRRLIHTADTGHLATVSHGTPRQDLRRDRGSVDVEVAAAGDVLAFQLKTFKSRVSSDTLKKQDVLLAEAERKLRGSSTHLVVLEAEAVKDTYDASLRQAKNAPTSRADKYAALEPLMNVVSKKERHRLLTLLGLTENQLEDEKRLFDENLKKRRKLEEEQRVKREEKQKQDAALDEQYRLKQIAERQKIADEAAAKEAKQAAILEQQNKDRAASQAWRDEIEKTKQAKLLIKDPELEKKKAAKAAIKKAKELKPKLIAEEAQKQEALLLKRIEKEKAGPPWPPKTMKGLARPEILKRLGFLPNDWDGKDPRTFLDAKKRFFETYGKPEKGSAVAFETDKPNEVFKSEFPSKDRFESLSVEGTGEAA
jgi:hypothetical protein